jgi:phage/plasmid-like protein (TIGR03299 family)
MHEVENMMYVGTAPWHRLGVKLEGPPTAEDAIRAAGLDWDVELVPVMTDDGQLCRNYRAVRRSTDQRVYAVLGDGFRPLQNREAFSFFDPFIASGEATFETAGSLRDGSRVWILAKIATPAAEVVPGDSVESYVLLSNSHDGTMAVRTGYTNVRVVCQNTLTAAHAEGRLIRIKHTSNVKENVDAIRDTMVLARRTFEATIAQYRRLAATDINREDFEKYVTEVFAPEEKTETPADGNVVQLFAERVPRNLERVTECFESGAGHKLAGKTLWGAYNAVTEYVQHVRGTDASKRLDSAWFGQGEKVNVRAMTLALKRAAA